MLKLSNAPLSNYVYKSYFSCSNVSKTWFKIRNYLTVVCYLLKYEKIPVFNGNHSKFCHKTKVFISKINNTKSIF